MHESKSYPGEVKCKYVFIYKIKNLAERPREKKTLSSFRPPLRDLLMRQRAPITYQQTYWGKRSGDDTDKTIFAVPPACTSTAQSKSGREGRR